MPTPASVLHICAGNQYGGVESMLACLARSATPSSPLRHTFALCFEGRFSRELQTLNAPIHFLPSVRLSRPWEVWRARSALRQCLRSSPPAIVVTHSAWARLVFGRTLTASNSPTVAWIHGASSPLSRMDRWAQKPHPNLVLVNSRYTADLTQSLFPNAPREIFHYPVPPPPALTPEIRLHLRESLGAHPQHAVLLIAARIEPWKGHTLLLDALAQIPPGADWICWVAGGPQTDEQRRYLPELRARAQSTGTLPKIQFLGERTDVPQLMAAADVYCQPNLGPEPFGIVFIEALYAGCPVVATALGGALEILNDTCGRLVPPSNPQALAQTLTELIQNPTLRSRLGAVGPARARELCDPTQQVLRLDHRLQQLRPR